MLTVACVKWGKLYGPEYVNKLHAMVRRNLTLPYEFVCLTDNSNGLNDDINWWPLERDLEGWWGKLSLFKPGLFSERVLFFDLDTVILGNIDAIAAYDGSFAILRDFNFAGQYGSGVMAWKPSDGSFTPHGGTEGIWDYWNSDGRPRPEGGDQVIIEKYLKANGIKPDLWQDLYPDAFVSYKIDCFYVPPKLDAKVVCFHGTPKPHECKRKFITDAWTDKLKEFA